MNLAQLTLLKLIPHFTFYTIVVSFDVVLQLMIANNVPFRFTWIQFLIEDAFTIAHLILFVHIIKQTEREHLMIYKKKEKQTLSEIAFNLTVATITSGCLVFFAYQLILISSAVIVKYFGKYKENDSYFVSFCKSIIL